MEQPFQWSFRNHVRVGADQGRLQLRRLPRRAGRQEGLQAFAARLRSGGRLSSASRARPAAGASCPSDPGRSLLLTKPTGAVPHGGGLRFDVGSLEYRVLSEWIAAGMPPPQDDDPRLARLEILPAGTVLKPGDDAAASRAGPLHATATSRTSPAGPSSRPTNDSVAQVDDDGLVQRRWATAKGPSPPGICSQVVAATVSVAVRQRRRRRRSFAQSPRRNFIDELVLAKLREPEPAAFAAGRATASSSAARILDTIGVLPTADETRAFLADTSPDKRDQLIEHAAGAAGVRRLLDLQVVRPAAGQQRAAQARRPCGRTTTGSATTWRPTRRGTSWSASWSPPRAARWRTARPTSSCCTRTRPTWPRPRRMAFLGMSISCAKCHNHPLEKWTNDQYYGMANLFARVRAKDVPGDGNRMVFAAAEGDLVQPLTGKPQPPRPLDGEALPLDSPGRPPRCTWPTGSPRRRTRTSPGDHQPRVGQLLRRRAGRERRRPAAHQPGQQRGAARRGGQAPGRAQAST